MFIEGLFDLYFDEKRQYKSIFNSPINVEDKYLNLKREEKLVLYYLYKYGQCNMGDITASFNFPLSTTNYIVKGLENKNIIIVEKSKTDSRVRLVSLSPKGKSLIDMMLIELEKFTFTILKDLIPHFETVFKDDLEEEEILVLKKLLNKVSDKINSES
ncbi:MULTISPECIES: MarR family winged helix-turn-helix transcriptional regulator [Clostridium]|uniref:MarR family winged helix-turn-helix transcriptional regulator n=1 Tax=Clostridium TaxID=1485 RepID=UPI001897B6ED|nr:MULTISPECIES: MarR family winged helix-turn-helix transcriptional regulator [Clostridium]MDI9215583.1 MarR family winged helix-turn-helix transcriptional regulator [Clostridium tertium]